LNWHRSVWCDPRRHLDRPHREWRRGVLGPDPEPGGNVSD
jgi:hypothetical protein